VETQEPPVESAPVVEPECVTPLNQKSLIELEKPTTAPAEPEPDAPETPTSPVTAAESESHLLSPPPVSAASARLDAVVSLPRSIFRFHPSGEVPELPVSFPMPPQTCLPWARACMEEVVFPETQLRPALNDAIKNMFSPPSAEAGAGGGGLGGLNSSRIHRVESVSTSVLGAGADPAVSLGRASGSDFLQCLRDPQSSGGSWARNEILWFTTQERRGTAMGSPDARRLLRFLRDGRVAPEESSVSPRKPRDPISTEEALLWWGLEGQLAAVASGSGSSSGKNAGLPLHVLTSFGPLAQAAIYTAGQEWEAVRGLVCALIRCGRPIEALLIGRLVEGRWMTVH